MVTLRIEHGISDFALWRTAFDRDPLDRAGSGVRGHRVQRPAGDPLRVLIDLDFDTPAAAEEFRGRLEVLWRSPEAAPALRGAARVAVVETVEARAYRGAGGP